MPLTHARVAITATTPTLLTIAGAEYGLNVTLMVQNLGSEAVYLGGDGLTNTSYGVRIVAGGAVTIDNLPTKDEVYALSASGNSYVGVLTVGR